MLWALARVGPGRFGFCVSIVIRAARSRSAALAVEPLDARRASTRAPCAFVFGVDRAAATLGEREVLVGAVVVGAVDGRLASTRGGGMRCARLS